MKSIFDTISWWTTESYMHKCMNTSAVSYKPKLNCLIYMIYLILSIKTIKNTYNILKHISYTLGLNFNLKICWDGCFVKLLFLIMTKPGSTKLNTDGRKSFPKISSTTKKAHLCTGCKICSIHSFFKYNGCQYSKIENIC